MKDYFDSVDVDGSVSQNRSRIIDGIEQFVVDEFGAEPSRLNLNNWKLRFDVDCPNQAKLEQVVDSVNKVVDEECPVDCVLYWEYIPTDSNDQKDGWFESGKDVGSIPDYRFPVEAFRVTVPRD
jgi:hypothetical protein